MTERTVAGTAIAVTALLHRRLNERLEGKFISQIAQQPALLVQHLFAPDKRDMHDI